MVSWEVNAERVLLLAWPRAILMQLAHPLVAAGVAEHSTFRGGLAASAARLHHTVRAMVSLTYGDAQTQARTYETIRDIHRRVHGRLPHAVGPFPAGTPYSAEDPALVLWVHATLVDSIPRFYDRVAAPLAPAVRDAYCAEAAGVAVALGAHEAEVPRTWAALQAYLDAMLSSGAIVVGAQARELADAVLTPQGSLAIWPALRVNRFLTAGLLPPELRRQYGFEWDARRERWHDRLLEGIRLARRALPRAITRWPESRRPRP